MDEVEYERKAHDWAEIKYNCKLIKKTWRVAGGSKKIIPDFSSDNSECVLGDAKAGSGLDDANLRQAGYSVLKMLVIERDRVQQQCKKFLVFENKEKGMKFRNSMEGALVLIHLLEPDSFEIWYWNGNDDEERLYPLSS